MTVPIFFPTPDILFGTARPIDLVGYALDAVRLALRVHKNESLYACVDLVAAWHLEVLEVGESGVTAHQLERVRRALGGAFREYTREDDDKGRMWSAHLVQASRGLVRAALYASHGNQNQGPMREAIRDVEGGVGWIVKQAGMDPWTELKRIAHDHLTDDCLERSQ